MDTPATPVSTMRFGDILSRGFRAYFDNIGQWMPPMLTAAAIALVSYICCIFPFLIVAGPLACGIDYCAICVIRGRPIDSGTLERGREVAGPAILGYLALQLLFLLPLLLVFAAFGVLIGILAANDPNLFVPAPAPAGGRNVPVVVQPFDDDPFQGNAGESTDELQQAAPAVVPANGQPVNNPNEPPFVFIFAFYGVMIVGSLVFTVWTFWLSTRLIFVLPLIADRHSGVREAIRQSWESTRSRFWELLVLNLLAGFAVSLGMQFCYIGLIFTLPAAYCLIASAYVDHFPEEATDLQESDLQVVPDQP